MIHCALIVRRLLIIMPNGTVRPIKTDSVILVQ